MIGVIPKTEDDYGPYIDDYFTKTPAFSKYTVELKRGEQQVFQITARTFQYYVKWNIEIELFVDGETRTVVADAGGKPIETTALMFPPGGTPVDPDQDKYEEVYDFFASEDGAGFARTK